MRDDRRDGGRAAPLLGAIPAGLAALMLAVVGVETSGRRLEEISPPVGEPVG